MAKKAKAPVHKRPMWSGSITIGLVNVPVKLYPMIFDHSIHFRFLHKKDGQPLRYEKVCIKENKIVPWAEVERGYPISKNKFIVFKQKELEAAKPESTQRIRIDKFFDYLSVNPIYFERSYLLMPDKSEEAYSLLLTALQTMGKAGIGRVTLRTKEYPVVVHPYKTALVLTALRYPYEVADPTQNKELRGLREPKKEELELTKKIIADLSGEFDIALYRDRYREKVEALIQKKMKGEAIVIEKMPVKEEAKELMVALQETLKQIKKK